MLWIPLKKLTAKRIIPQELAHLRPQAAQVLKLVADVCPDAEGGERGNGEWIFIPKGLRTDPKNLLTL